MDFNFKSLHQSNIVFVEDPATFLRPENADFASLYSGDVAAGAKFADDAVLGMKYFHIPKLQLSISLERTRLRVDDESRLPPDETKLIKEALHIHNRLFQSGKLKAFGFNFDFFYRFPQIIPTDDIFKGFASKDILKKAKLRDMGVQFALEKENGRVQEVCFIKFTGPTEIALHYNIHREANELPKYERIMELYRQAYLAPDAIVKDLKFS